MAPSETILKSEVCVLVLSVSAVGTHLHAHIGTHRACTHGYLK